MTIDDKHVYLALQIALRRIAAESSFVPSACLAKLLTLMDPLENGYRYGIWESEEPFFTLAWKNHIEAQGMSQDDWGFVTIRTFLTALSRTVGRSKGSMSLTSAVDHDISIYKEALRLLLRKLSPVVWIDIVKEFAARSIYREGQWWLRQMVKASVDGCRNALGIYESKGEEAFVGYFRKRADFCADGYAVLLSWFEEMAPREAAAFIDRIGKTAFRIVSAYWFWYDNASVASPDAGELPSSPAAMDGILGEVPSYPVICAALIMGLGLSFGFDGRKFEVCYPFGCSQARLIVVEGNSSKAFDTGNIDKILTYPHFYHGGAGKGQTLLKTIRECPFVRAFAGDPRQRIPKVSAD